MLFVVDMVSRTAKTCCQSITVTALMNPIAKTGKKKKVAFRNRFVATLLNFGLTCEQWASSNDFHRSLVSLAINGKQLARPVVRRIRDAAERMVGN